jgi:hypothetical protein
MAGAVCITTKAQAWETATDSHSHSPHADAQRPSALGKPFPCSDLGPLTTIDLSFANIQDPPGTFPWAARTVCTPRAGCRRIQQGAARVSL